MKTKVQFTISRTSNDEVSIRVFDNSSRTEFVSATMSMENYAMLITGLAHVEAYADIRGLENVGKTKIVENRSILSGLRSYATREETEKWLIKNGQEDGWILNSSLNSQGSIGGSGDNTILNYTVYKYVPAGEQ